MIITIGRECGCDGDEVAARLASKYGIACYTKKEIIRLAKEKGVYDKYPFFLWREGYRFYDAVGVR